MRHLHHPSPAGLRVSDHAAVGLRQISGGRWVGGSPTGDSVSGGGPWPVLSTWHYLQCRHHTGNLITADEECGHFYAHLTFKKGPIRPVIQRLKENIK